MTSTDTDLDVTALGRPVPTREPSLSFILSGYEPVAVENVGDADREPGQQRLRIRAGDLTLFIERRDVPEFVSALITAASTPWEEPPTGEPHEPLPPDEPYPADEEEDDDGAR